MKLGSLFDGSGGFPLAGILNCIEPVWASEIEAYPIRVTKARFPDMKHLGDVTKIDGGAIEPVDIITFGSPCQDLSVAGKQAGIHEGKRSNLFFEAIRIIREMRNATANEFPRWAVWENVQGAFSSNKGADFQAVLQAFCTIQGQDHIVPMPPKGRWTPAGCIVGDGWSVAWRVYDAQFWGVPQRRKRIYLIADFGSERAGEILFECESLRGDFAESGEAREGIAADAQGSAGGGITSFAWGNSGNAGLSVGKIAPTIKAARNGEPAIAAFMGGQGAKARSIAYCDDGSTPTLKSAPSGGNTVPDIVYAVSGNTCDRISKMNGKGYYEDVSPTLNTQDKHAVCYPDKARSLCARHDSSPCIDRGQNVIAIGCRNMYVNEELSATIQAKNEGGHSLNYINPIVARRQSMSKYVIDDTASTLKARDYKGSPTDVIIEKRQPRKYIVRRLTPTECARLQGFPDWWTDGADGSDSAKYKLWGNGIALPCAEDVIGRIAKACKEDTET